MRQNARKRHPKLSMWQKLPRFETIIYNSFLNILFQVDVHAKSSTAQSWMTLQSHARNPSITKITNAVPKFKKMNSMNVLTTVTVRLVLKNVELNIVWLYKIALVQKIAHVSYIVIFHEYIRLKDFI